MILIIFPHQLFENHPGLRHKPSRVVLVEDPLFFGDTHHPAKFHKQKLWLLRATMKRYAARLEKQGHEVKYFEYDSSGRDLTSLLRSQNLSETTLAVADPVDFLLEKRLRRAVRRLRAELVVLPTPSFINARHENEEYREGKKRWFMADFYKWQRQRLDILMDGDQPFGGKWSFDEENRKKVPAKLLGASPPLPSLRRDEFDKEAVAYVTRRFGDNPGSLENLYYPTSHSSAKRWLRDFLDYRFVQFGDYEDAIVEGEAWLWHSVLSEDPGFGIKL